MLRVKFFVQGGKGSEVELGQGEEQFQNWDSPESEKNTRHDKYAARSFMKYIMHDIRPACRTFTGISGDTSTRMKSQKTERQKKQRSPSL